MNPAQVLIDKSKTASLLVVGNRGHSAFTGLLPGSVSIHCVTGAFCPRYGGPFSLIGAG
jgi:nucleotide-binding universal stress UspA family protein